MTRALVLAATFAAGVASAQWARHTIDDSSQGADGVRLADIDGDGRQDIVTGWEEGGVVRVYTHPGPDAVRGTWRRQTAGEVQSVEDAVFADLDGDGDLDVVSACEGRTKTMYAHWAPDWRTEPIPATAGKQAWMYCLPVAGHLVVGSKGADAGIGRLRVDGPVADWSYTRICDATWIMSLRRADLNGDGRDEIVASDRKGGASRALWIEPASGAVHTIGSVGRENMFLDVADLDGDGWPEVLQARKPRETAILKAGPDPRAPWREIDAFSYPADRFGDAKAVRAGNLDADPALELVLTCEHATGPKSGCLYADRGPDGWTFVDIGGPEGVKFDRIELLDLDEDGDLDVLTCEERDQLGVIWYENPAIDAGARRSKTAPRP